MDNIDRIANGIKEWFPLYVEDWMTSEGLQACSIFTKGIFVELMIRSWYKKTPGKIKNGSAILSRVLRCSEEEYKMALSELESFGVVINKDGIIEIPRLIAIAQEQSDKHNARVKAGKSGKKK